MIDSRRAASRPPTYHRGRKLPTSQQHIFAVGDVIGVPSLGSVSMEQDASPRPGFGIRDSNRPITLRGLYIPEISFIGKTETVDDDGIPYEVAWLLREIAPGRIRGDTTDA